MEPDHFTVIADRLRNQLEVDPLEAGPALVAFAEQVDARHLKDELLEATRKIDELKYADLPKDQLDPERDSMRTFLHELIEEAHNLHFGVVADAPQSAELKVESQDVGRAPSSNLSGLRTLIDSDILKAAAELLKTANQQSQNKQLKRDLLKTNWQIEDLKAGGKDAPNFAERKAELASSLSDSLTQLEAEQNANPEYANNHIAALQVVRSRFLEEQHEQKVMFKGTNFTFRYGSEGFGLKPINLTLKTGEITAIVGENGSGKSTLIKVIAGEHLVRTGNVAYPEFASNSNDWVKIKEQVAYIPQRINKWSGRVKDYLHFTAAVKGMRGAQNDSEVEYIIHRLGLGRYADANWGDLSGGYQMRFELARMLVWKPKLLILDEPLANLDPIAQASFLRDLDQLSRSYKHPISVVITSQHIYEIEGISDHMVFLKNGEAQFNGATKDIGTNRTNNSFEIEIENSVPELEAVLIPHGITEIERAGKNLIVKTPMDIDARAMLKLLCDERNNITVLYFRDISGSTRTLF